MLSSDERDNAEDSIVLLETVTAEAWAIAGTELVASLHDLNWAIGDWVLAGIERYGTAALNDAVRITRSEIDRLAPIVDTCRQFTSDRRRPSLRFAHHQVVLKLDDATAQSLLDQAEREHLTVAALRAAVRIAKDPDAGAPVDDDPEDAEYRAIIQAYNRASSSAARDMAAESIAEAKGRVIAL